MANQIQAISTERTQALPYVPDNLQGKEKKLTRHEILASSKFGRPGLNHSFTTEASFEHVFIFILKNNYMSKLDKTNLLNVHPLFKHFDRMLSWSYNIQFANIKEPIKNYSSQASINTTRVQKMLARHTEQDQPSKSL